MKTSILVLIMGLGLNGSAWAYDPPCNHGGQYFSECPTDNPDGVGPNANNGGGGNQQTVVTATPTPKPTRQERRTNERNARIHNTNADNTPTATADADRQYEALGDYTDSNGKRCGNYNGMGCTGTEVVNQSSKILTTVSETAAAVKLNNDSAARKQELTNKIQSGVTVKNKDFNDVTRANIDQGVKQHHALGSEQMTIGAAQTTLAILHSKSADKLKGDFAAKKSEHDQSIAQFKANQQALDSDIKQYTREYNDAVDEEKLATQERNDAKTNLAIAKSKLDANTPKTAEIVALEADVKAADAKIIEADRKQKEAQDKIAKAEQTKNNNYAEREKEDADFNEYKEGIHREIGKQEEVAGAATVGAAQTIMKGSQHFIEASAMEGTKASITDFENNTNGTGAFTYNPQTNAGQDEGVASNTPQVEASGVTTEDPNGGLGLDGGIKDFNPNIGAGGAMGPAPGAFKEGPLAGAGGGGQGAGGAGGTSASRGDGGGEGAPTGAGKPQTGGQYASGDGATKFSRGGGSGAGVGFSSGLSDLLKKMLPGGDEKKGEKASLDLASDRSPASDQAAVIGRNKNIFIEISKRYQKKNSEKAVYFQ